LTDGDGKHPHGKGTIMRLESIKYQTCPYDNEEGVLLTDIDEIDPETNEDGDLQYYCLSGHHTFAYNDDDDE
jgi:hypothetical protein